VHASAVEECLMIDPRDDQARYFSAVLDRRENKLASCRQCFDVQGNPTDQVARP
jgi:hypothetical protein